MCHVIVLYVSVTNTKANATLVTEHNFSGYVLFNLFLFVFLVISVNVDLFVIVHNNKNLKSESYYVPSGEL